MAGRSVGRVVGRPTEMHGWSANRVSGRPTEMPGRSAGRLLEGQLRCLDGQPTGFLKGNRDN
ncbi:hypothetical protein SESBI_38430 [Sesbania bispinosa]|nr:hypothetical protein SESBI_38430 [Sesbania bispinosa]